MSVNFCMRSEASSFQICRLRFVKKISEFPYNIQAVSFKVPCRGIIEINFGISFMIIEAISFKSLRRDFVEKLKKKNFLFA